MNNNNFLSNVFRQLHIQEMFLRSSQEMFLRRVLINVLLNMSSMLFSV